jgi:CRP-like cAMP-binding protein/AmiR/NasT family two-component response regulator
MPTKVLVVEDEGVVALDIMQELESSGYSVVGHVTNGEDAVNQAVALRPDVILMDVNIQGDIDGITAAEQISGKTGTPVIFVTAHADEVTLQRAKLTRPFGYIIKPFEPNELRANIEITMHRAKISPQVSEELDVVIGPLEEVVPLPGGIDEYKYEAIRSISLFEGMPLKDLQDLASCAVVQDVGAGEFVSMDGERPNFGFMVLSGRLAVVKSTPQGKELTLDLLIPGDCTGMLRALEPMDMDTSVRGQVDAKVLAIPAPQLRAAVEKNPTVYRRVAVELMQRSRRANDLALGLAHSRVESRIVAALLALAPRFGRPAASNDQTRIFLTRKELADLTGTTPETAIRVTKNLEREGLLDLTKPGVIKILSLQQLREAVE